MCHRMVRHQLDGSAKVIDRVGEPAVFIQCLAQAVVNFAGVRREPRRLEKVVDRLLASPAYGERMAMAWLDLARYSDTHGYHYDNERTMWPWRDWVIDAYNRNLPFDRFTVEQLAGDLLPEPDLAQRIATDRLANGRFTSVDDLTRVPGIGPRIIERIRPFAVAEAIDLQVSTAEHPPTRR